MTKSANQRFWDIAGHHASIDECVRGQRIIIDDGDDAPRRYAIVTEVWKDGHGNTQVRFRDACAEERPLFDTEEALVIVL